MFGGEPISPLKSKKKNGLRADDNADDNGDGATSCFDNVYVKWVESAGARVVPIRFDDSVANIDTLFDSVNAILFTGGGVSITDTESGYMQTAGHLLNRSIDAFVAKGDRIPVWGTCMGIQTLSVLVAQDPAVLSTGYKGVDPLMMPLDLTANAQSSRMFGGFTDQVKQWVATKNVTTNLHHDGIEPDTFAQNSHLNAL